MSWCDPYFKFYKLCGCMTVEIIAAPKVVQERARWINAATFPRCYFAAFLIDESNALRVELTASGQVLNAIIDDKYYERIDGEYCREVNAAYIKFKQEFYYLKLENDSLQRLSSDELIQKNDRFYLKKSMAWLDCLMTAANHEYSNKVRRTFYKQGDDSYSTDEPFRAIEAPPTSPEKHIAREHDDKTQTQEIRPKPKSKIHRRPSFNSLSDLKKSSVLPVDEPLQVNFNLFQPAAEIDRPSIQHKLSLIEDHYFSYASRKISLKALKDVVWRTVESPSRKALETAHLNVCSLFQSYGLDADQALSKKVIGSSTCTSFKSGVHAILNVYKEVYALKQASWPEASSTQAAKLECS